MKIEGGISIPVAFLVKMLLVMLLIYVLAVATPALAAKIDAAIKKRNENRPPEDERLYQVRSVFEPGPDDPKPDRTLFPELKEKEKNNRKEDNINGKE